MKPVEFASRIRAVADPEIDFMVLKVTARTLAMLVQGTELYAQDSNVRLGVLEVLRLTEPKRC